MATLLLTDDSWVPAIDPDQDLPTLRTWLRDGWAILFSHPDDFFTYDMESDRLLKVIEKTYSDRDVRPMAVTHQARAIDRGWVARVSGDAIVRLDDRATAGADVIDLRTRTLSEHLTSVGQRFVVLVDSLLRRRKTFVYERSASMPSPLDFLVYVDALRNAADSTNAANDFALSQARSEGIRARWGENYPLQKPKGAAAFNGYAYSHR